MSSRGMSDTQQTVIANGQEIAVELPLSLQRFLEAQGMPPRSVVVELNGEAVSPSEFSERQLQAGDTMEIVRVVAGG
ncbi:MAG TPA: thiamine biosynthesis protein ThiS [Verrucomicrobiales bacterium]|nr:thiamine biosynthesis protein ThiS [Verrucomicrobiales bacterium]HAH97743.1 thiamine biosynthesis protein ThiS [Verrucomicrobiales bacterium]